MLLGMAQHSCRTADTTAAGRAAEFVEKIVNIQKRVGTTVARGGQHVPPGKRGSKRSHGAEPHGNSPMKTCDLESYFSSSRAGKDADLLAGEAPTPSATTTTPAAVLRATQRFSISDFYSFI